VFTNLGAIKAKHREVVRNSQLAAVRALDHGADKAKQAVGRMMWKQSRGGLKRGMRGRVTPTRGGGRLRLTNSAKHAPYIEFGRGPVVAKRAKALRFVIGGVVFYRKRVKRARAYRFLWLSTQAAFFRVGGILRIRMRDIAAKF